MSEVIPQCEDAPICQRGFAPSRNGVVCIRCGHGEECHKWTDFAPGRPGRVCFWKRDDKTIETCRAKQFDNAGKLPAEPKVSNDTDFGDRVRREKHGNAIIEYTTPRQLMRNDRRSSQGHMMADHERNDWCAHIGCYPAPAAPEYPSYAERLQQVDEGCAPLVDLLREQTAEASKAAMDQALKAMGFDDLEYVATPDPAKPREWDYPITGYNPYRGRLFFESDPDWDRRYRGLTLEPGLGPHLEAWCSRQPLTVNQVRNRETLSPPPSDEGGAVLLATSAQTPKFTWANLNIAKMRVDLYESIRRFEKDASLEGFHLARVWMRPGEFARLTEGLARYESEKQQQRMEPAQVGSMWLDTLSANVPVCEHWILPETIIVKPEPAKSTASQMAEAEHSPRRVICMLEYKREQQHSISAGLLALGALPIVYGKMPPESRYRILTE